MRDPCESRIHLKEHYPTLRKPALEIARSTQAKPGQGGCNFFGGQPNLGIVNRIHLNRNTILQLVQAGEAAENFSIPGDKNLDRKLILLQRPAQSPESTQEFAVSGSIAISIDRHEIGLHNPVSIIAEGLQLPGRKEQACPHRARA